ncbi:MAG: T9SS type A sorting domain-containing protein [Bacteroidales bacterium]|nr:T9SS type A sorting domain-containing protein [Bacteroidales bacterium]
MKLVFLTSLLWKCRLPHRGILFLLKDSVNSPVDTIALNYQFRPNHPADSILYKTSKTNKGNLIISSVGVAMPSVVVVVLDFSALEEAIADAQTRVDEAVEGTGDGEYLTEVMDMAENAIADASEVLNSAETQEEIDNAVAALTAAMEDFIPNEINSLNNISETVYTIYPNPAGNFIYIENAGSITQVEIFSVVGEKALVEVIKTENMAKVNLSSLENGIYFIKITNSENNSIIQKIIKK